MIPPPPLVRIVVLICSLWSAAWAFSAPPPGVFDDLTLEQARQRAKDQHRLLIVYPRGRGRAFDLMDENTWNNPTLALWMKWHAVSVVVDAAESPLTFRALQRAGGPSLPIGRFPSVLVFLGDRLFTSVPDPRFSSYLTKDPYSGFGDPFGTATPIEELFYPRPTQILFQLDFTMDRLRGLETAWLARHEQMNPPPEPPEYVPMFAVADGSAPAVADPTPDEPIDVLQRWQTARQFVQDGLLYDATGQYTWLWERAPVLDPALSAARTVALPVDIADLVSRRPGARTRFERIRDQLGARLLWKDFEELFLWMVLNEALTEEQSTLEYLAAFTLDGEAEATMAPPEHRLAYTLLSSQKSWTGLLERITPDDLKWIQTQVGRLNRPRPRRINEQDWASLQALRRRLLIHQACRLYASALARGREGVAQQAAGILLESIGPRAGPALAATALAFGLPRQRQIPWLDAAESDGAAVAPLRRHLEAALARARPAIQP